MASKIESIIAEIEQYIDGCKYKTFSNTEIIVNKEEIDSLLQQLSMATPNEIKSYQKIISNREAILNDARAKAEALIKDATVQTTELINEHEIMQQAYAEANKVVMMAHSQAQEILDSAAIQANEVKAAAMQYLDDMLANLEGSMTAILATTTDHYESFYKTISSYNETVRSNRAELHPMEVETMLQEDENGMIPQEDDMQ